MMPQRSRVSTRKRKQPSYYGDSDGDDYVDYEPEPASSRPRKRRSIEVVDLTADEPAPKKTARGVNGKGKKDSGKGKSKNDDDCEETNEEKRLRRFRTHPPKSYLEIKARALSQRLTVLSRERVGSDDVPEEKVVMAGSTGNVYTQRIGLVPSCDCPHAKKGNQCKHILYVMLRVLKVPEHIGYQLALTSSELRVVFKNAAPIPTDSEQHEDDNDGKRKPIEGECPICYCDFEPEGEAIVYCKAACGNNVHKGCMQSWIASTGVGKATCPYCRAKWEDVDIGGAYSGNVDLNSATMSQEGYVNVASQLGLSDRRDYSSYHRPWVSQQNYHYRRRY